MRQTDFSNDEAVGYLADRLARLGVEEALAEAGRRRRATRSLIGDRRRSTGSSTVAAGALAVRRATACGGRGTDAARRRAHRPRASRGEPPTSSAATPSQVAAWTTTTDRVTTPRTTPTAVGGRRAAVVVKVGSSSLTTATGGIDAGRVDALVDALAGARGRRPRGRAGLLRRDRGRPRPARRSPRRPRDLATQQAAASVGQGAAASQRYTAAFARHGLTVGQVLLTADDVTRRGHYRNAHRTLDRLLDARRRARSSTRTTPSPPTRSGSATTTGWPRSSPTSSTPTRWCCSPTSTALYDGDRRAAPAPRWIAEVRGPADLAGVRVGRAGAAGVGTGGMVDQGRGRRASPPAPASRWC